MVFKKRYISIASAAVIMAGPGHFASTAAAQTMGRGPVAGVSVIPTIGTGMNSPILDASSLISPMPNALTVPSLLPAIAGVPAAMPGSMPEAAPAAVEPQALAAVLPAYVKAVPTAALSSIQTPSATVGAEEKRAALNAMFDGQPAVTGSGNVPSAPGGNDVLPFSQRMESLYSALAFTEGAMYETRDGRAWSIGLVSGRLNRLLIKVDTAYSKVASSPARIALTYARTTTAAEITDSNAWPSYSARAVYNVFNAVDGYITQAINGENQNPDTASPSAPIASQAERLESLHLLAATIQAAIFETSDGRDWSIGLVRNKLTAVQTADQPAFETVVTLQAKIALIRVRAIVEAEIADSGSWPSYTAQAVYSIFTKLQGYVAQAIENESSQP